MNDVAIVGGGETGLIVAQQCADAGLRVVIIEASMEKPDDWNGEWINGRGVVSAAGLVAVLDPATGDERRLIQTRSIIVATGKLDPANPVTRMLGITKLGALLSPGGLQVITNRSGHTRAKGVYATGGSASTDTPGLIEDIVKFCTSTRTES